MIEISLEKRMERYDVLSERIRQAMNSDDVANMTWLIGEVHHLDNRRIEKISKIIGYIMMGFIHPEDLQREITSEVGIDKRLAEEIAHELRIKILNPLMPEINAAFNYNITGVPLASQPEILRPAFAPRGQEVGTEDQPFILHEEQKIEPARIRDEEELMRPSFYEEEGSMKKEEGFGVGQPVARLEIGGVNENPPASGPLAGRTEEPLMRVVHYSGPQTPIDPFAPQQIARSEDQGAEPPQPSKEIHPENVVDLKDLPR